MLVLSKLGTIYIFDPSSTPAQPSPYLTLPDVDSASERGLTSIAIDPDFETSGSIYVFYSHSPSRRFRISRFTHQGNSADLASEQVIWQDNENINDCCHYGGGLQFGPDGKLYLTTGEEFDGPQSQDLTRAGGKIIRINKDGSSPSDNPFADGVGGNLDEIWAYGLRNPYRAHWDLVKQRLYISEVGGNLQETAREDIHLGRAGANYGWPYCEGVCEDDTYDPPIYSYSHSGTTPSGGAVTAGTVYRGDLYPSLYNEVFFFADYAQGFIRYLAVDPQGNVTGDFDFASRNDGVIAPVHVILGADGALYYVDYYLGSVSRITYSSGNQAPAIDSIDISPSEGNSPLTVTFTAVATDLEDDPLTYTWHLGNGETVSGASAQYTYEQNGSYNVYLDVSDGDRSVISSPFSVQVGLKPEITIDSPSDGMLFRAGDTIHFSGSAYDSDGILVDESFEWNIDFLHNAHTHPVLSGYTAASGQLEINTKGHDYHDTTGYRLKLKVTDQDGLSTSRQVSVYPDKVDLTFESIPAGMPIFIDGVQSSAPFVYDSVIDFNHVISVPTTHCIGDVAYEFVSWSNGKGTTYNFLVPDSDTTLQAEFQAVGSCGSFPSDGLVFSLSGDIGVQTTDGVVTDWLDQSGQGNHLTATGSPVLQENALNQHNAVVFDGASDAMTRISNISGLPSGNADRTVIAIVNYFGVGMGGISYGDKGCGNTFGLVVDSSGDLVLQGWCNDFTSSSHASGGGWFTHSVVLKDNVYRHFVDGVEIDSGTHEFNTSLSKIVVGSEIDGNPYVDMAVAGIYIYDRALSDFELGNAHGHINNNYFLVSDGAAPVAADDYANLVQGGTVVIDVLSNDSDADSALLPSSIDVTRQPQFGTTSVNYIEGTISYSHDGTANFQDSFEYTVSDDQYLASNSATVSLAISESQASIGITSPLEGQTINDTQVIVDFSVEGSDFDHIEISLDGQPGIDLAASSSTYTFTDVDAGSHTLTARLVNATHQSIVATNTSDTVTITVENDGIPHAPVAEDDNAALSIGESVAIMVLENDTDSNANLDITSVEILSQPTLGSVQIDAQGVVTYTHDQVAVGSDSFTYRVYDLTGLASNEATVTVTVTGNGPAVPASGLVLRLEADEGVAATAGTVTLWQDLSGQGNDLNEVSGDPQWEQEGLNGHAVISFDGTGDELRRSTNFNNLPAGAADRTLIMVANYRSLGYGGFAYGDNACGNAFGLGVTNTGNLFVQRWCADQKTEIAGTGSGWIIQAVTVSADTMTHYLNGNVIATGNNGFNTLVDRMVLGAEIDGSPTLDMQVAAIYIYDHALTPQEISSLSEELTGHFLTQPLIGEPPIAQNDITDVIQGSEILIDVLANDSDTDGSLVANTVAVATQPSFGIVEVDTETGQITYRHGGASTSTDSFSYTVEDDAGNTSNAATVSIGVLTPDAMVSITSPSVGETINSTDVVVNYTVSGADFDHLHLSLNGVGHNTITDLTGTFTFSGVEAGTHTLTAQLVNAAHQPLVTEDAVDTVNFMVENNGVPEAPVAVSDTATLPSGESVAITVLENDTDSNDDLDITSVEILSQPSLGSVQVDAQGVVTYTHDQVAVGSDSFTYRVYDLTGLASNEATVTVTVTGNGPAVPASGLVLRLEADEGVAATAGTVTLWQDLSGQGNDLNEVSGDPQWEQEGLNGHAVISFDGTGDELRRSADLNNLPAGAADRTVIMVANYRSVGYGGFAYGDNACGNTFGLGVTNTGNLFVQSWCADHKTEIAGTGSGWIIQAATVSGNTMTHYLNGNVIATGANRFDTLVDRMVLGAEIDGSPTLDMQVAAIYIYDHALTPQEISSLSEELTGHFLTQSLIGEPPIAQNDITDVIQGSEILIDVLANDSDTDGSLVANTVAVATQPSFGIVEVDTETGQITYRHGGASTSTDSFSYTVEDDAGNTSNAATVSIGVLTPDAMVSITSPSVGETINSTDVVVNYTVSGTDFDHLHLSLNGVGHNTITDLTGTFTFSGVEAGTHTLTAQLVNAAHQPLVTEDAVDTVNFMVENNGVPEAPVAVSDTATLPSGESVTITVLENDTDSNDDLDITSVEILSQPSLGSVQVDAQGVVTYTHDQVAVGSDSFTYRVYDLTGLASNEATVTVTVTGNGPAVPASGLVLRLEADEGVAATAGTVTLWQDLSGQGNDLNEVSGDPQWEQEGLNGHAVISFDGTGDELRRSADLNNLPAGAADRTVIMVANYRSLGYGGFAYGDNACGNTFGLGVTNTGNLFVQRWCADQKTDIAGTGAGWMIQAATISGNTMTHYLNGNVIATGNNGFNTLVDRMVLGAEIDGSPTLDMQVAAIYIYDHALTEQEMATLSATLSTYYLP